MIRIRLLWFTVGFAGAFATMGLFIFRDLWLDRKMRTSQVEKRFIALEARVKNLENFYESNSELKPHPDGSNVK